MLDIQKLIYLQALVENNFNITAASQKLFISQPAMSKMILNLEREEDMTIFVRRKGRIVGFTNIGQKFYDESIHVVNAYNSMLQNLQTIKANQKETLTIAASPVLLNFYLPDLFYACYNQFPNISFSFIESSHNEAKRGLIDHTYNFAVLDDFETKNSDDYGIDSDILDASIYNAFISKNHLLKDKLILNWKEISQYPLAYPSGDFPTLKFITQTIAPFNSNPHILLKSTSWQLHINTVLKTNCISILPKFVKLLFSDDLEDKIIQKNINDSSTWFIKLFKNTHNSNTPAASRVREFILDYSAKKHSAE